MKEIRNILQEIEKEHAMGRQMVLATVVHVEGSAYRRPGARMLISETGELTGAISGGCLEGEALEKALLVMANRQSRVVTFDTMEEDALGAALGCNGIIKVLLEPLHPDASPDIAGILRTAITGRQKCAVATLFSAERKRDMQPGTCLLLDPSGYFTGNTHQPLLEIALKEDMSEAMNTGRSCFRHYRMGDRSMTAFIEFMAPPVSLVVVGAGNDAMPLVALADTLGWEVRVVDGRPGHARQERFVSACQVLVSKPEEALEHLPVDEYTVFVLMTHNYLYDKAMMKALMDKPVPYIGMLGPAGKIQRMMAELKQEGLEVSGPRLDRIFTPAGLDMGAETPEEIALSIISEIKSVLSGRKGGSLRLSKEPIHPRSDSVIIEKILF